jgi:hypothetical protein
MKVKELIEMLQQEDQEKEVIMSKDGEGNNYSPFADFGDVDVYKAESTWSGYTGYSKLTAKQRKEGYGDADIITDGVPALVLYPVN